MDRKSAYFWGPFLLIFVATALASAYSGLFGSWTQASLGVTRYYNWDPDGFYLGSGIEFFEIPFVTFRGHPGLPLQFMIGVISYGLYSLWPLHSETAYIEFVAEHQYALLFIIRMAIAGCHFVAIIVLYKISRIFLTVRQAWIASVLYATTSIVINYIVKISAEPFLVIFTFLAYWYSVRSLAVLEVKLGFLFSLLASLFTSLSFLTKLTISFPLPLFYILIVASSSSLEVRRKLLLTASFAVGTVISIGLLGGKINWNEFFVFWADYLPVQTSSEVRRLPLAAHLYQVSANFVLFGADQIFRNLNMFQVFSLATWQGQLNASELPLFLLGGFGVVHYWHNNPHKRPAVRHLMLLLLLLSPVVIWKSASHYRFVHLAGASIFAAYMLFILLRNLSASLSTRGLRFNFVLTIALGIFCINGFGIALAIDAKATDLSAYSAGWKQIYECMRENRGGGVIYLRDGNGSKQKVTDRTLDYYFSSPENRAHFAKYYELRDYGSLGFDMPESKAGNRVLCTVDIGELK